MILKHEYAKTHHQKQYLYKNIGTNINLYHLYFQM